MRIYNRALSGAEIQADMNSAVAGGGASPLTLTTPPPETLTSSKVSVFHVDSNYGAILRIDGPLGRTYSIEASENLKDWNEIGTMRSEETETYFFDPEAVLHKSRFYRLKSDSSD